MCSDAHSITLRKLTHLFTTMTAHNKYGLIIEAFAMSLISTEKKTWILCLNPFKCSEPPSCHKLSFHGITQHRHTEHIETIVNLNIYVIVWVRWDYKQRTSKHVC